jgi:hypothetical protein
MGPTTGRDPADRLAHVGTVRAPVALAMPARRARWERVQVNARVRVEIEHVLQRFVRDHDTTVQSCVDLALEEFLTARGYPPTDQVARAVMADAGEVPS